MVNDLQVNSWSSSPRTRATHSSFAIRAEGGQLMRGLVTEIEIHAFNGGSTKTKIMAPRARCHETKPLTGSLWLGGAKFEKETFFLS